MNRMKIGLQLYTVRDETAKDFAATVRAVAKIGYRHVELAGYGSLKTAAEVRKAMDDAGVSACGSHIGLDQLETQLDKVMDDNDVVGNKHLIVPWVGEALRSEAGYRSVGTKLEALAPRAAARGFTLSYHNHSFEFAVFGGKTGLDLIFEGTDPAKVRSELDVYWVRHGQQDPVAYIRKLGKRLSHLHLKDMSKSEPNKFAAVGTGMLDIKGILAAGAEAGVEWGVVEQDNCYETPTLKLAEVCFQQLRQLGAV